MAELGYLTDIWNYYRVRLHESWDDQTGAMTTERAILAGLALAVGAIIVAKVTAKAESIPTDSRRDEHGDATMLLGRQQHN